MAANQGGLGMLKVELSTGSNPNELHILYGRVLHWAIVVGKHAEAELLLAAGADVNAHGKHNRTPLHFACARGDVRAVRLLVGAGADTSLPCNYSEDNLGGRPPADGPTPIDLARDKGHADAVTELENVVGSPEERYAKWAAASEREPELSALHLIRRKRESGALRVPDGAATRTAGAELMPEERENAAPGNGCEAM